MKDEFYMDIEEIDKWLNEEYGCSFTKLEELHDWLLEQNIKLKDENEHLKLLCETQNNREYRSKFLKEFRKEKGENVYPDYDEIYKRYDEMKVELQEANDSITWWQNRYNALQKIMDKALEFINSEEFNNLTINKRKKLIDILKGDSDE